MKSYKSLSLCILLIGFFSACAIKKSTNSIVSIKHGSSFGMCSGYCYNEFSYNESNGVKYSQGWGRTDLSNYPDKYDTIAFNEKDWDKLLLTVDLEKFYSLPETIGCPDCADGGAEWVEIRTKDKTVKVMFEHGEVVPEMSSLLLYLREKEKP